MQYEMAEDDQALIDRILRLSDDEILAYVRSLPELEQQPMAAAILRAASLRAVADYRDDLHQGHVD
jgi:hypothetical protein